MPILNLKVLINIFQMGLWFFVGNTENTTNQYFQKDIYVH